MAIAKYKACQRWNNPGDAHELTFSCYRRYPLLSKDRTRDWMLAAIRQAREKHAFDLWAYVVMPEHVHLLIRPRGSSYDISSILRSLKWPVAHRALGYLRKRAPGWIVRLTERDEVSRPSAHFWQPGGEFDRNADRDRTALAIVEYIHFNPVRRELARAPEDWRWSSAGWYAGRRDVPRAMDDTLLA
jgi:putative transposase